MSMLFASKFAFHFNTGVARACSQKRRMSGRTRTEDTSSKRGERFVFRVTRVMNTLFHKDAPFFCSSHPNGERTPFL